MERQDVITKVRRPEDYLRVSLAETRELNQRDQEEVTARQGRRYRGVFVEYRAVYPERVPACIPVGQDRVFDTRDMQVYSPLTQTREIATDAFWGAHGYDVLLRVALGMGSGRNGHSGI